MSDFHGLFVALATPFDASGNVDVDAFRRIVRHVVNGGTDVLVPLGTTGESATLEDAERDLVISTCLEEAGGRKVVVGTGSNSTRQAVRFTARAKELGAHGALVVTPYYNKPTPSGLVAHYSAIAQGSPSFPIVAYNVPGRTGLNVTPEVMDQLWKIDELVSVKESSGNLLQMAEFCRRVPANKRVLSGDDNLSLPSIAVGASGVVSVLGNLVPGPLKQMIDQARNGEFEAARATYLRLLPLMNALFVESNPIPLKAGLEALELSSADVRLPLTNATETTRAQIRAILKELA